MTTEKTKSQKVHKLDDDEETLPTRPRKALKEELEHYESVINLQAPSPRNPPSPEEATSLNAQGVNKKLLAIQTGSNSSTPSLSPASTLSIVTTEGGMTPCGDGGQNLERVFLKNNPDRVPSRRYVRVESVVKTVRRELNRDETKVQSATPSQFFIPCTELYSILSKGTVGLILRELYPNTELGMMNEEVLAPLNPETPSFRRTIAILILIYKEADLRWFFRQNINDSELPSDFGEMKHAQSKYAELDWDAQDFRDFCRVRSEVSPVFFAVSKSEKREKIVHYQCRSGEVVPFTKHNWTVRAGYGEVSSYNLHEDQQNLHRYTEDGVSRAVAVKKLYRADKMIEFKKEYAILDRLSHLTTPHIAKLLVAYAIPSGPASYDYFLMFECADHTLSEIWKREPQEWRPTSLYKTIAKWVASQSYGLTKALEKLHNFRSYKLKDDTGVGNHGIHGDLKPDNILHYNNWRGVKEELGILQITDFGLSSFHQTQSAENIVLLRGTHDYRPPEAAILSPLSSSFDTWSLGCLFLEFITWLVRGPEGLKEFRERRSGSPGFISPHPCFWMVKEEGDCTIVSLSRAVREWVIELYEDPKSSKFVRDFCELIVNRMLLIEELERTKRTEGNSGLGLGSRTTRQHKRIATDELAKKLYAFKRKPENYFAPSPLNGPHKIPEMGHCIILPRPLYRIREDAIEKRKELLSALQRAI